MPQACAFKDTEPTDINHTVQEISLDSKPFTIDKLLVDFENWIENASSLVHLLSDIKILHEVTLYDVDAPEKVIFSMTS